MALEEPPFCKLSRLLTFDCAGIERLSVPQPNCYVSLGESICIVLADIFSNLVRAHQSATALSQARRGPTHPVTVMFYTPAGPCSY